MSYEAHDLKKHRSWFAAYILFFYHSELTTKFPAVSNALYAGWQTIHTKPMDATALATPPHDFDEDEIAWCNSTTEYLKNLLDDDGRAEIGFPADVPCISARTKQRRCWRTEIPTRWPSWERPTEWPACR